MMDIAISAYLLLPLMATVPHLPQDLPASIRRQLSTFSIPQSCGSLRQTSLLASVRAAHNIVGGAVLLDIGVLQVPPQPMMEDSVPAVLFIVEDRLLILKPTGQASPGYPISRTAKGYLGRGVGAHTSYGMSTPQKYRGSGHRPTKHLSGTIMSLPCFGFADRSLVSKSYPPFRKTINIKPIDCFIG